MTGDTRGSVREVRPGRFEIRLYVGRVDGRARYVTRTVAGTAVDAEHARAELAAEHPPVTKTAPAAGIDTLDDESWQRIRAGRAAQGLDPDRITDPVTLRRIAGLVHPTNTPGAP